MSIDHAAAVDFLRVAYRPDDWIAVFLKSYVTGRIAQRVIPISVAIGTRLQDWLQRENDANVNVYVSVNAVTPAQTSRRRSAVAAIRHLFLDADSGTADVLAAIGARADLPSPSYVLASSLGRAHLLWRVRGFSSAAIETLQKTLARQLQTDTAATSCAQLTRLPGFFNHKYIGAQSVTIEYRDISSLYGPADFPRARRRRTLTQIPCENGSVDAVDRARRYVAAVPPAIAGQHGDLLTFRVCCRLVRGFALTDVQAFGILGEWNAFCEPPWTYRELRQKLDHARKYGREPIGGLLER